MNDMLCSIAWQQINISTPFDIKTLRIHPESNGNRKHNTRQKIKIQQSFVFHSQHTINKTILYGIRITFYSILAQHTKLDFYL